MRLIDAPIGIFRFDSELVLKTEYYSENKQSGKYIPDCYIVRTGEYFWGGAKTANELINLDVEPVDFTGLLPTITDTISRQAAIDYFVTNVGFHDEDGYPIEDECELREIWTGYFDGIPSAESKRIRGKWVGADTQCGIACSVCGVAVDDFCHSADYVDLDYEPNFCPNCGAKMEVTE